MFILRSGSAAGTSSPEVSLSAKQVISTTHTQNPIQILSFGYTAGGCLMDPRDGSDYDYMSRGVLAASTPQLAKAVIDLGLAYPETKRDHEDKFSG